MRVQLEFAVHLGAYLFGLACTVQSIIEWL